MAEEEELIEEMVELVRDNIVDVVIEKGKNE